MRRRASSAASMMRAWLVRRSLTRAVSSGSGEEASSSLAQAPCSRPSRSSTCQVTQVSTAPIGTSAIASSSVSAWKRPTSIPSESTQ
jgi:hypothetical protein